ncbi:hypothetical protein BU24DRAFT_410068 [Aaosphaeria arxii CBS 175.79]|uniref:Uncharacterized protein n=1 Tax=Aaosphaeria arxii CBS 175.79 TaxID=1450172 RepID=A0A6A5XPP5_9PLEO|nr:uncharacterized protein BU24DRAFT_410068 [Aaosphaeria arxii CBS 175.79]KAF2014314.1 hypothetical protein BU24DRAFT_410068 [Aaosphaeria arxii CBS 175.79]
MAINTIIPLLHLLTLTLPSTKTISIQSPLQFYTSLTTFPRLPANPTPLDRLRYTCHRAYFQYLVTGPGYVLETPERLVMDAVVLTLLAAVMWCAALFGAMVWGVVGRGLLSSSAVALTPVAMGGCANLTDAGVVGVGEGLGVVANLSVSVRTAAAVLSM